MELHSQKEKNEHAYILSKKTYTAVRIGGNFKAYISFGHAIPSAKVLSPVSPPKVHHLWTIELQKQRNKHKWRKGNFVSVEKFTIFEPLNYKNRELNTNEGKEILLVWIAMNL